MSYTKTNWQTGDTITAEKLNHAEQGIYDNSTSGGDVLIVHATTDNDTLTLDKTWKEIFDSKLPVIELMDDNYTQSRVLLSGLIISSAIDEDPQVESIYQVETGTLVFQTNTEDGYPVLQDIS